MRLPLLAAAAVVLAACAVSDSGAPAPTPNPSPPICLVSWPGSGLINPSYVVYEGPHAEADCLRQVQTAAWRYVNGSDVAHALCSGRLANGDQWTVAGDRTSPMTDQLCRGVGL